MARVKRAIHGKKKRRVVLERAKGYYGNKSRSYRSANEQVMHSLAYAYRDRRARKGDFRKLWIQRINAAARIEGMSYSRLIAGLHRAEVTVDRKILADIAVRDPQAFAKIVAVARDALGDDVAGDAEIAAAEAAADVQEASAEAAPAEATAGAKDNKFGAGEAAASVPDDEPVVPVAGVAVSEAAVPEPEVAVPEAEAAGPEVAVSRPAAAGPEVAVSQPAAAVPEAAS